MRRKKKHAKQILYLPYISSTWHEICIYKTELNSQNVCNETGEKRRTATVGRALVVLIKLSTERQDTMMRYSTETNRLSLNT